jgi:hypothetical protein
MLVVWGLIELNERGIVILKLILANNNAKELLVSLGELLSPPTNSVIDKDKNYRYNSPQNYLSGD